MIWSKGQLAVFGLVLAGLLLVNVRLFWHLSTDSLPNLIQTSSDDQQKKLSSFRSTTADKKKKKGKFGVWSNCTVLTETEWARKSSRSRPLIVFYTDFWFKAWGDLKDVYLKYFDETGQHSVQTPACMRCELSTDRTRLKEADLVVFHQPNLDAKIAKVLPPKYCGQYWVLMNLEAPPHYEAKQPTVSLINPSYRPFFKKFDVSSSYRLDSDVPLPHYTFWYEHKFQAALQKPVKVPVRRRDADFPVAWIASKCRTENNRYAYVEELMKHIPVKSYGKCLHNADIPKGVSYDEEAHRALSKHKFYLAFENANCDYYVTEKVTRLLELGVIPVIMGCPQISLFLPNSHSAILVTDYESPKELAKKLHEINSNDKLFEKYISYKTNPDDISPAFKKRWFTNHRHRGCKLCDIATNRIPKSELKGADLDLSCKPVKANFWVK